MSTKELAMQLLNALEELHLENLALKSMFLALRTPGWQKMLEQARSDREILGKIRAQFQPLYTRLEQEADLESAIQEFLANNKLYGKPN
jgi:hypothetical protein